MNLALFASDSVHSNEIADCLRREGVVVCTFAIGAAARIQAVDPKIEKGVLITDLFGAGPITQSVRTLFGIERALILCARQTGAADREVLMSAGATVVITPHTSDTKHIAERILAQLILDGDITPQAIGNLLGGTQ